MAAFFFGDVINHIRDASLQLNSLSHAILIYGREFNLPKTPTTRYICLNIYVYFIKSFFSGFTTHLHIEEVKTNKIKFSIY